MKTILLRYHLIKRKFCVILEMNEPRVPLLIRIRAGLKASLEELAKQEHRSTNQQIEFLLERAVARFGENLDRSQMPSDKKKRKQGA